MRIPSGFVAAIVILVLEINATEASCFWIYDGIPGTECLMRCINSNTTQVNIEIEELSIEKSDCRSNGIWLRLRALSYPNNTIASYWFTADVKVFELEVYLTNVKSVAADAFNANAFRTVKKLTFENFGLGIIQNGIFNGLNELEIININGAKAVNKIEKGVLDTLTELQEFTFDEQSPNSNPEISINGLTGSQSLSKLENVRIKYNLTDSLKKSSFIGLTHVKRLDLSACQIKSIEDNAFDPISATIEELDLSGNALTTVTIGVFNVIFPNIQMIYINGNKWHCDCDLLPLRLFIEEYRDNFTGYNCASPSECRAANILESDCFSECEIPSTSTSIATTTTSTTTTAPPNTNVAIECRERNELTIPDTVSIKRPIGHMTITENENGEVKLKIENEQEATSPLVIWFDQNQKSGEITEEINCISYNEIPSIPITNLTVNVTYMFCLMDSNSTSVSPLDCTSYVKRDNQIESAVWLFESSKTLAIILIVLVVTLNVVVGIAIGFCMLNYNPFSKHNSQISKFSIASRDSVNFGRNTKDRMSNITSYTNNTMSTSVQCDECDTFKRPPLPERPPKLFEEPVYASVED